VVTRTDLIKLWTTPAHQPPRRREVAQKIERALPHPLLELLQQASELASEMGYPLYVVGGFVRDLLLGEPNLDMDLVVEGDAIKLARRLARQIPARTRSHKQFGTAKIILDRRVAEFGVPSLDFATARMEFYAHSAALPEVERSSIKADLHRRDFTINTMAIRLDSAHYGELLDFYGAEQDLRDGLIRALHSLSFVEDPTRIMRAARFEQRLGFVIESRTAELIDGALSMLSRVSGERIRHELHLILEEREPERVLCRLEGLGVLKQIHPHLGCSDNISDLFRRLRQTLEAGEWDVPVAEERRPLPGYYLALLTYSLSRAELEGLADRLKVLRDDLTLLRHVLDLRDREGKLSQPDLKNHEIDALLRLSGAPALMIFWLAAESELARERVWFYQKELRAIQPALDGDYLKSIGLKPSPLFSRLLQAVRNALLDGEIRTEAEEKALVDRLLAEWGERNS
jgi:tRNA nucleotidyltransferase (CCA-adding enzyme)